MRIAIFSMTPLFENQVMGGSQQILEDVACHLGSLGHRITIYSTKRWDSITSFKWHPNVLVKPIFDFKQPYPNPYATKPYSIAAAINDLRNLITSSDRLYIHDSAFLFPYVYKDIPTVGSLPDVVYSETLLGSFTFAGCSLIVPSEHTRDVYLNTLGRFFPELRNRLSVIHNGFDFSLFKRTKLSNIFKYIPEDIFQHEFVILHPHRPEPSKGLDVTIQIVENLVKNHGIDNLITLIPLWIETEKNKNLQGYYRSMQKIIRSRNLEKYFYFHPWLPREVMPQYFSQGSVMFSFGTYVETFGNAVYEAIGCGTPVVVSNRGPHRTTLPDQFAEKVEPNDVNDISSKVEKILHQGLHFSNLQLDAFRKEFSIERMVNEYSRKILYATIKSPMKYVSESLTKATLLTLPSWIVRIGSDHIINEFNTEQHLDIALVSAVDSLQKHFTVEELESCIQGLTFDAVRRYMRNGWLVPVTN